MDHITCTHCNAEFTEEKLKKYIKRAEEKSKKASGGTIIQEIAPGVIFQKKGNYYLICPKCNKEIDVSKQRD